MKLAEQTIYLDVCALGRPYDDLSVIRNEIEAASVHLIMALAVLGEYTMYHSPVHDLEINKTPDPVVRTALLSVLDNLGKNIKPMIKPDAMARRARDFMSRGIKNLDALHLAHAEQVGAAFITCDDKLLAKCKREKIDIWYGSPVDFCRSEGKI